jgi:hypothetical protein
VSGREPFTAWGPVARRWLFIAFVLACIVAAVVICGWRP